MMHLTVLVDNHTQVGTPFLGESGLSYLLAIDGKKILFDTGSSDLFLHNAKEMNLDLSDIEFVVLSHGHGDHTGGLQYLPGVTGARRPKLVTHPLSVVEKQMNGQQFGMTLSLDKLKETFDLVLSSSPLWISEHLVFLGEIPRHHLFENQESLGERIEGDNQVPDNLLDDSALAVRTENGLFIVTGCSHAGICNIVDYAREVCQESRISGVVGGFHVFKADERTQKTAEFLKDSHITNLYPCHCTGFKAKALIDGIIPIGEVSVGTRLDLN
jgi:7,8-dihydropterin-6-yl-methyl-4-(beta-D-ribofuranosyl)aminobenzene 5'-phosphate synthase